MISGEDEAFTDGKRMLALVGDADFHELTFQGFLIDAFKKPMTQLPVNCHRGTDDP